MTHDGHLLKVDEVAALLRTDPSTVRRKIRQGELAASKPCGQYLVSQGAVELFLDRARVAVARPAERRASRPPPSSSCSAARPGAGR